MHAWWMTSFRVPVSGGYGGALYGRADTEGWIPGYRPWDGHRGFRTSGVVDEQLQLLFNVSKHVLLGLREGGG